MLQLLHGLYACGCVLFLFLFVSNACVHSSILLLQCRFFAGFVCASWCYLNLCSSVEFIIVAAQCIECDQQQLKKQKQKHHHQSTEATLEFKSVFFKIFSLLQMENKNLILQSAPLWALYISLLQHAVRLHSSHSHSFSCIHSFLFALNFQQSFIPSRSSGPQFSSQFLICWIQRILPYVLLNALGKRWQSDENIHTHINL